MEDGYKMICKLTFAKVLERKYILPIVFVLNGFGVWSQNFQPFPEDYNRLVQGISISPDSKRMYYTLPHKERLKAMGKTVNDSTPRLAMYESYRNADGTWSEPKLFNFSGNIIDYEPTILPDGKTLLFNSRRPLKDSVAETKNNIWVSILKNGVWQEPQSLKKINTSGFEESYATVSASLRLVHCKEVIINGKSQHHLFETVFKGVDTPRGNRIDFPEFDKETADPHISKNGDYLVFTGYDASDWNATCDLYISFFKEGEWTKPKALKELNSKGPDFAPFVSFDGSRIFYRKSFQFLSVPFKDILRKYL